MDVSDYVTVVGWRGAVLRIAVLNSTDFTRAACGSARQNVPVASCAGS
jgi:hypothetical protein